MTDPRADSRGPANAANEPSNAQIEVGDRLVLTRGQKTALIMGSVLLLALAYALSPILTPFLFAFIVAYMGNPLVTFGERYGVPRALGTLLVLVLLIAIIVALLLILVPMVRKESAILVAQIPAAAQYVNQHVLPWVAARFDVQFQLDPSGLHDLIASNMETAQGIVGKLFASLRTGGAALIGWAINILLVPIVLFYLLRDWGTLFRRLDDLLPRRWRATVATAVMEIDGVLSQFLRGQLLVMLALAAYYSAGLWFAGLDVALPVGILTGLLVFIPYVGYGLGLTLAILAALLQFAGWNVVIGVLIVYGLGQMLEGFFLTPRLVGGRIGLHPLAVIFALLAFGQLFGFFGVLLALPVSAALVVALRHMREQYLASALYRDR